MTIYGSEKSFSSVSESSSSHSGDSSSAGSGGLDSSMSDSSMSDSSGSGSGSCSYTIGGVQLLDPNTGLFIVTNTGSTVISVTGIGFPTGGVVTPEIFDILPGQEVTVYISSYLNMSGSVVYVYTTCGDSDFTFP